MKPFNRMSDSRHEQLMKAATQVIDMVGMTVDPDAALTKVARDSQLTAPEVDLVSHAVNNALAYEHIHTADDDLQRAGPFPLTNAETVKSELYPDKVQDVDEHPAYHAPDALDTAQTQKSAAASYVIDENYNLPQTADPMAILAASWGLPQEKRASMPTPVRDPFTFLPKARHQQEELQLKVAAATDDTYAELQQLITHFSGMTPVDFEQVKTACSLLGVGAEVVGFVAEALGKTAEIAPATGDLSIQPRVMDICQRIEKIALNIQQAGSAQAEIDVIEQQTAEKLAGVLGDVGRVIGEAPETVLGQNFDEQARSAFGQSGEADKAFRLGGAHQQFSAGSSARDMFNAIREDDYLKSYDVGSLAEAYNAGVEAGFGDSRAKLLSFVRQYLASDANVPIDLMVRAQRSSKEESNE